jgi:hypothetical protein
MPYPILPVTPNFDDMWNVKTNTTRAVYGEGGVVQRERKSTINRTSQSIGIGINILDRTVVDAFLLERMGRPYRLSLDGGSTDDGRLYRSLSWVWDLEGLGVASFSAEAMQARRLKL